MYFNPAHCFTFPQNIYLCPQILLRFMSLFNYIVWAPDPDLFHFGGLTIRWYGLLFATGFLVSQQILFYIFRQEGKPESDVETLTIYMVIATIIGARLGHVLFYEPDKYLAHPIDILKIWEGGLASHGATIGILTALYLYSNYKIKMSLFRFKGSFKKQPRPGQSFLWVVDRIVIVVALTGCLIRFGNFMNSEIIGLPTHSSNGVVFGHSVIELIESSNQAIESAEIGKSNSSADSLRLTENEDEYVPVAITINFNKIDAPEANIRNYIETTIKSILTDYPRIKEHIHQPENQPLRYSLAQDRGAYQATVQTYGIARHPAQLYESISSLLLFFFLFYLWKRRKGETPEGLLFGLFLIILFTLRFLYEFLKENQVDFENELPLNMGQLLSIPLVIIGIYLLFRIRKKDKPQTTAKP